MNRAGGEILGARAVPSLGDVPEAPELVVLSVPAAGIRSGRRRGARRRREGDRGDQRRSRRAGRGGERGGSRGHRAGTRCRRGAARAELPRGLRRRCGARPRLERASRGRDRVWSRRAAISRSSSPGSPLQSGLGLLALRLARKPGRPRCRRPARRARGPRANAGDRALPGGLSRRPCLRRGGSARSRRRHSGRPAARRDDGVERARGAVAHRRPRQRLARDRRGVRCGWDRPGRDTDAADRRRPGAARASTVAAGGASPSTPTVAGTGSSRATSSPRRGSRCRRSLQSTTDCPRRPSPGDREPRQSGRLRRRWRAWADSVCGRRPGPARLGRRGRSPAHGLFRGIRRRHAGARGRRGRDRAWRSLPQRPRPTPCSSCRRRIPSRPRQASCVEAGVPVYGDVASAADDARAARALAEARADRAHSRRASRTSRDRSPAMRPPAPSSPKRACP